MRKMSRQMGFLAAAALAFTGCNTTDHSHEEPAAVPGSPAAGGVPLGERVLLKNMGKSIQVEIRATADEAQVSVMAGLEDQQEAQALEYRLDRTGSLGEAYALISGEPAESAPTALRELDLKVAATRASGEPPTYQAPGSVTTAQPLSKASAADPDATWDWAGDWTWFNALQTGGECSWASRSTSRLEVAARSTRHKVIAMAASHVWGSDYTPTYWNGNQWVSQGTIYLAPRHYYAVTYTSANSTFRIFYNVGRGGSSWRVYLDAIWNRYNGSCTF